MTKIQASIAMASGRRFKDTKGNIYQWSDDDVCETPFRLLVEEKGHSQENLLYNWCKFDLENEMTEIFEIPDLATDTKVLVTNDKDSSSWLPRHSRGWTNNGDIVTFDDGRTSYTATPKSTTTHWKYWKIDEGKYEGRTSQGLKKEL